MCSRSRHGAAWDTRCFGDQRHDLPPGPVSVVDLPTAAGSAFRRARAHALRNAEPANEPVRSPSSLGSSPGALCGSMGIGLCAVAASLTQAPALRCRHSSCCCSYPMMLFCTATAVQEMLDRLRRGTYVPPRPAAWLLAPGKSRTATGAALTGWSTSCRCACDKLPASFPLRVGSQLVSLPMYHAPSCTKFPGESRPAAQIGGEIPPGLDISYRCISISWYRVINIYFWFGP
jgi:hypothetical protein